MIFEIMYVIIGRMEEPYCWYNLLYEYIEIIIFQSILINSINNIITVDMIDVDKIPSCDSF